MAKSTTGRLLRVLRSSPTSPEQTDRELMTRFTTGDPSAFDLLVNRHCDMVLGVCRRMLPTIQDAEDACQATFLVLARKAKSGRWQTSIANWLYTTARRVASKANRTRNRRHKRESQTVPTAVASPLDQITGREVFTILDEELERLPAHYREPLVLCYLEGLTRDEASQRLGVSALTIKAQLDRGRKKLGQALSKRGIVLSASFLVTVATSAGKASSPKLRKLILATVNGSPSPTVAQLAQGVAMNGILTQTKLTLLGLLGMVGLSLGLLSISNILAEPQKPAEKMDKPLAKGQAKNEAPKQEVEQRVITGKVLDANGKPIQADLSLVWMVGKRQSLGQSNRDGTFQVTVPFQSQAYGGWLVAKADGHGLEFYPHGIDYLPQAMTKTANITMKLPKERPIKGRIVDHEGKAVANVRVLATSFDSYDSDTSADAHMKKWATELFLRGAPPNGDRFLSFSNKQDEKSDQFTPYKATTDQEGRFEIKQMGQGHCVILHLRGKGIADREIVMFNRDGFDPEPFNKITREHEYKEFGGKWVLYGADPTIVVEPEKLVRGTVMDHNGKPRAGVRVVFSRINEQELNFDYNQAVTDNEGKYEIRGARKHKGYMVECPPDLEAGLLQCQGFADDTPGYEPITIDLKCAKGIVVTGTVTNKATGQPIQTQMYWSVLNNNPFVKKYPPFLHGASIASERFQTDKQGRFRLVTIPGPVLLMAGPMKGNSNEEFKPPVADSKYPEHFFVEEGHLMVYEYRGGRGFVQGCWCKVLDAKETESERKIDIELEPANKLLVQVVDHEGKPVTDTLATGVTHVEFANPTGFPNTDTLTVYNLEPKKERLLAVVHPKRQLVGTATVKDGDKNPVVTLGSGGTVRGRIVDSKGKPLAGLNIYLGFERREVREAFEELSKGQFPTTDPNGEFQIDQLFPGQTFRLLFSHGNKRYGPAYQKAPKHTINKHGETLSLGEWKLEPSPKNED